MNKCGEELSEAKVHLMHGEAAEVIPQFVSGHGTDLLVMGTIGRTGLSGILMGNTAERILNRVECSVLAVKPAAS